MAEPPVRLQALWPFPLGEAGRRWRERGLRAAHGAHQEACLERAAAAGDLEGMVLLGDFYATHGQRERALPLFRAAAERGHGVAAFGLAELMRWEYPGGSQGLKESFRWYVKAAEAGFGPAQTWLAQAYANGEGVPVDPARAEAWAARTPSLFWPPSCPKGASRSIPLYAWWETLNLNVGQYATRPWYPFALATVIVVACFWFFGMLGAPSCGLGLALVILGLFNLSVLRGPFRRRLSTRHLERRAEAGDSGARHRLGLVFRDGAHDVPQDRILACRHFRVAAEAGHTQAMVDLAELLWWGKGGDPPDPQGALAWIVKARALGHPGLEEGEASLRTAVSPASSPVVTPTEQRLTEAQRRWEEDLGPRASRWLLAGASVILFGIMVHLTYRNTSWIGRRDKNRVVWGDALNRVAAPRDAMTTLPIPASQRLEIEPLDYVLSGADGSRGKALSTQSFRGRPALVMLVQGRFPAFRESLLELNALVPAYEDRAAFLVGTVVGLEGEQAAAGVLAYFAHYDFPRVPMGTLRGRLDQPALGDLSLTPVTLVLDRQSRVRQRWVGFQPGLMKEALDAALAEGQ